MKSVTSGQKWTPVMMDRKNYRRCKLDRGSSVGLWSEEKKRLRTEKWAFEEDAHALKQKKYYMRFLSNLETE